MCFSPTMSFAASAALMPIGIYCMTKAAKQNPHYLFFAAFPFLFGLQQFIEGLVWIGLMNNNALLTRYASMIYLFFAFFWWPFFSPLTVYFIEKNSPQHKKLLGLMLAGAIFGLVLYVPLILNLIPSSTVITVKSIDYVNYLSQPLVSIYLLIYVTLLLLPMWLSSNRRLRHFGLLVLISAIATWLWYNLVFTSVWCFFAALLSMHIVYILHKLPVENTTA